jgi:hypothetical protein
MASARETEFLAAMPRRFAIAEGPNSALSCLICAASTLTGGRPNYRFDGQRC